jgi:NADPH:quinone reductase-like Zn-dependent oxidoreductase
MISRFGAPTEVVELAEVDLPAPGPRDVVVAIEAAPINPSDILEILGVYGLRPQLPAGVGAEAVGRIVATGPEVRSSSVGERVLVIPGQGYPTWREQTIVNERDIVPVDPDADALQLAMLGINPLTAYSMLHGYAKLEAGAWVAQTGASSATAGHVVTLAKRARFRTLNIVRRESAVQPLLDAGADAVVVGGEGLAERARESLGGAQIDLLLDAVGGDQATRLASLVKPGGAVISYSALDLQPVSVMPSDLIFHGLTVYGYWLYNWMQMVPRAAIANTYRRLGALIADGTLPV